MPAYLTSNSAAASGDCRGAEIGKKEKKKKKGERVVKK